MINPLRIGGLSSGMDIDGIVEKLMTAERMPLTKLNRDKQVLEWKKQDYRTVNAKLTELRNLAFDMTLSSHYLLKKVSSSNESVVTATAGSDASATSYEITVNRLASTAANQSEYCISALKGEAIDTPVTINDSNNTFNITYNGITKEIKLDNGAYDSTSLTAHINAKISDPANFGTDKIDVFLTADNRLGFRAMSKETLAGYGITLNSGATNDALESLGFKDGAALSQVTTDSKIWDIKDSLGIAESAFDDEHNFEFTINGQVFTFDADEATLGQVINTVNKNKDAGVTMFYDPESDKIAISTVKTGDNQAGAEISVSGDFLTGALSINMANETGGENALLSINGLATERRENTFALNGVTFTLNGVSPKDGASNPVTTRVDVVNDTDAVFNKIKEFIEKYNEVLGEINKKLREERFRDYPPLTDEQKKELTDKEIDMWEEKAKSGLLKNDDLLNSAIYGMRRVMYSNVDILDEFSNLMELGIKTLDYKSEGALEVNDAKLREAIEKDIDSVMRLFTNKSDVDGEKGIAVRLHEGLSNSIKQVYDRAGASDVLYDGSFLGERIRDMNERIQVFEDRLVKVEERYWRQFTAMEKAISQMNQQSAWLAQQFASWGGQ
jgi:flagellar hook-associated protein 2